MELEFEGYYKRGIFITKKRYALIDENNKITIKGLEFVRRDWSNIAKKTQKAVLETLLKDGDIESAKNIIRNTITDLRNKKIDKKDLIIYTQLTKDINEYKTTAPHVEVAKKIIKNGGRLNIGDVIGYIITSGNKSISERATLPDDAKDYDISYWRTASQLEVDFILGQNEIAVEVKSTENVSKRHLRGLEAFYPCIRRQRQVPDQPGQGGADYAGSIARNRPDQDEGPQRH
jgi:DNA polymerase elongation subunit (family B)